MSAQGDI
jgi:hypothetical protein